MNKIGVIGCGNMASQIVKGIYKANKSLSFYTYTPTHKKAMTLAAAVNGKAVNHLKDLEACDLLLIGCKPQQWQELSINMNESGLSHHLCVSMLAATSFKSLNEHLPQNHFIRIMPNTPIGLGVGVTLFLKESVVSDSEKDFALDLFKSCSQVHTMQDEKMLDQVTTVSGCGPAYVYLFAKYLSDELKGFGMNEVEAKDLVITLFQGSSELMKMASDESLDELISKVTSKGGVTIEAVNTFKEKGLASMTSQALSAAYKRSVELTHST